MNRDHTALIFNWIRENIFFVVLLAVAGLLLGLKDILTLLFSSWPHLYPVSNTDCQTWESIYLYTPWARQVSLMNLFPADPFFALRQSVFTSFPFLTIWGMGLILKTVCFGNLDAYILVMRACLPLFSMLFIYLIVRRWLDQYFSAILAFLCIVGAPYPFIIFGRLPGFGWATISNMSKFIGQVSIPLEMTKMPYPSLSFVFFAATLLITVRLISRPLKNRSIILVGLLWGMNIYIYLFNFVYGVVFAFLLINGVVIKDNYKERLKELVSKIIIANVCFFAPLFAVLLPFAIRQFIFVDAIGQELVTKIGWLGRSRGILFNVGELKRIVLTYLAALGIAWVYKINLRDLAAKCAVPVLLLISYLLTVNLHILLGKFVQSDHFDIRIYMFLKPLNLIPLLLVAYALPDKSKKAFILLLRAVFFIGLAGIILMLFLQNIGLYQAQVRETAPVMKQIEDLYLPLSHYARPGETVASSKIAVNFIVPLAGKNATLFVPSFVARRSSNDLINKFALYAKIFNWDRDEFLEFISSPPEEYGAAVARFPDQQWIYDDALFHHIGYWFVFHGDQSYLYQKEKKAAYRKYLVKVFDRLDVAGQSKENGVAVVQSDRGINRALRPYVSNVVDCGHNYKIYRINYQ
ncbi:hypothetical protein HZC35_00560 [Candidatus Saganbacteria bacterium]|nr:hypothetical protein [Candidatus Saganbacteria bacterium]